MHATEVGRITPGATYTHHQLRAVHRDGNRVIEDVDLGTYRVDGFALDPASRREVVVYTGLDGPDAGRLFVCSLHKFALGFRPLAAQSEPLTRGDGE